MRYVSLFSGVEAASVAWSNLGWTPLTFAEVDEFPSAVLAHRFPSVPNLGDVCKIDWGEFHERHGAVDVLIGGSPCQSFSIAGGREGLKGESRLMFEYVRAVRDLVRASGGASPRYIVWENVPGCLSSNKGRDFGCLLDELEDCGYFVCWRTLDSQFARVFDRASSRFAGPVPQRRRRVFLIGSLGGPSAADILFERTCLRGDHPKGREAREALARDSEGGAGMGDSSGFCRGNSSAAGGIGYEREMSPTLRAGESGTNMVPGVLTADVGDNKSAIMFRGDATPKYSEDLSMTLRKSSDFHDHVLTPWDVQSKRVNSPDGTSPTLPSGTGEGMNIQPIVLQGDGTSSNGSQNGCGYNEDGSAYTLNGRDKQSVCIQGNAIGRKGGAGGIGVRDDGAAYTLDTKGEHAIAFTLRSRENGGGFNDMECHADGEHYVVRRLMPVECERLQAFPDGWTDITGCDVDAVTDKVAASLRYAPESKEYKTLLKNVRKWSAGTPDTPRYKAMGNSMTTLVIELLGRRIQAYDELHYDEVGLGYEEAGK